MKAQRQSGAAHTRIRSHVPRTPAVAAAATNVASARLTGPGRAGAQARVRPRGGSATRYSGNTLSMRGSPSTAAAVVRAVGMVEAVTGEVAVVGGVAPLPLSPLSAPPLSSRAE